MKILLCVSSLFIPFFAFADEPQGALCAFETALVAHYERIPEAARAESFISGEATYPLAHPLEFSSSVAGDRYWEALRDFSSRRDPLDKTFVLFLEDPRIVEALKLNAESVVRDTPALAPDTIAVIHALEPMRSAVDESVRHALTIIFGRSPATAARLALELARRLQWPAPASFEKVDAHRSVARIRRLHQYCLHLAVVAMARGNDRDIASRWVGQIVLQSQEAYFSYERKDEIFSRLHEALKSRSQNLPGALGRFSLLYYEWLAQEIRPIDLPELKKAYLQRLERTAYTIQSLLAIVPSYEPANALLNALSAETERRYRATE